MHNTLKKLTYMSVKWSHFYNIYEIFFKILVKILYVFIYSVNYVSFFLLIVRSPKDIRVDILYLNRRYSKESNFIFFKENLEILIESLDFIGLVRIKLRGWICSTRIRPESEYNVN